MAVANMTTAVWQKIHSQFRGKAFKLADMYNRIPDEKPSTLRGRLYEHLGIDFQRVARGIFFAGTKEEAIALVEGDGRDLSFLKDNSIDLIVTDHPWSDEKANKGGNRNFAEYETFKYTEEDFKEKARVLKEGCFLVEMLPAENESNFDYLYQIKKMAEKAGFQYYAKVPWVKGTFIGNTGRKAKNSEDMMIFSLEKARAMRPDAKKDKAEPTVKHFMSGANGMLPTEFNFQPPAKGEKIHQSEKPVGLVERLLDYLTFEEETVLDQFAGSGVVGEACLKKNRKCILIEKSKECISNIIERFRRLDISLEAVV